MTDVVYLRHGPRFAEAKRKLCRRAVVIYGACYDGTTSYRPGARFGPDALRSASHHIETYSPEQDGDIAADLQLVDRGNIDLPAGGPRPVVEAVTWATRDALAADGKPLLLGGEHTVSVGAVKAIAETYGDLTVIQIDAHADLRREYAGQKFNHACAMRRILDFVPSQNILQVGIRSGTRKEFEELRNSNRLVEPSRNSLKERLEDTEGPIYLTLDLDVFDPACLPGTGTPEPGGIDWPTFAQLLAAIPARRLVAADVVELAPALDPTGRSAVLAAKAVREIALKLGNQHTE